MFNFDFPESLLAQATTCLLNSPAPAPQAELGAVRASQDLALHALILRRALTAPHRRTPNIALAACGSRAFAPHYAHLE